MYRLSLSFLLLKEGAFDSEEVHQIQRGFGLDSLDCLSDFVANMAA
jgi:hypothetical protein